jgi:hypothetical protein
MTQEENEAVAALLSMTSAPPPDATPHEMSFVSEGYDLTTSRRRFFYILNTGIYETYVRHLVDPLVNLLNSIEPAFGDETDIKKSKIRFASLIYAMNHYAGGGPPQPLGENSELKESMEMYFKAMYVKDPIIEGNVIPFRNKVLKSELNEKWLNFIFKGQDYIGSQDKQRSMFTTEMPTTAGPSSSSSTSEDVQSSASDDTVFVLQIQDMSQSMSEAMKYSKRKILELVNKESYGKNTNLQDAMINVMKIIRKKKASEAKENEPKRTRRKLIALLLAIFYHVYAEKPEKDDAQGTRKKNYRAHIGTWAELEMGPTSAVYQNVLTSIVELYNNMYKGGHPDFTRRVFENPTLKQIIEDVFGEHHIESKYNPTLA